MGDFKFKFYIDTRYKSVRSEYKNKYPVKLRVKSEIDKKTKLFLTGIYLEKKVFYSLYPEYAPKDILKKKSFNENLRSIANKEENIEIKNELEQFRNKFRKANDDSIDTISQLKKNLGKGNGSIKLVDHYSVKADSMRNKNSQEGYISSYKSFVAFHNKISIKKLTQIWEDDKPFK